MIVFPGDIGKCFSLELDSIEVFIHPLLHILHLEADVPGAKERRDEHECYQSVAEPAMIFCLHLIICENT